MCEGTVLSCTRGACSRGYRRGERGREAPKSLLEKEKGVCENTVLSCTGGACSRGYRRGERGREAPKSLLEKELIEACANIGGSVVLSVVYYRMGPTANPLKEARLLLL